MIAVVVPQGPDKKEVVRKGYSKSSQPEEIAPRVPRIPMTVKSNLRLLGFLGKMAEWCCLIFSAEPVEPQWATTALASK